MLITCRTCLLEQPIPDDVELLTCPACGTRNSRPQAEGESLDKLNRANRLLHAGEFAEAEACFRHVLVDFDNEHEALWGKLRCQYGVEIVIDSVTKKRHPVVHIPRMRPMQETADFRQACEHAPEEVRRQYEEDAAYIDEAQAEIRRLAESCPPYDVFLCHKTTRLDGQGYTEDYKRANKLYFELKSRGYRVFFAPEVMEGVAAGANYEAHIFHALHTAKVMLVVCSDPANLAATWVQSEWQRYLELVDDGQGHLLPLLFGEMPASRLPQPFRSRKLEGIRMGEMGSLECLMEKVEEYCGKKEQAKVEPVPEPPKPTVWVCSVCGYITGEREAPPEKCPVCKLTGKFVLQGAEDTQPVEFHTHNVQPKPAPVVKYAPEGDFEFEWMDGGVRITQYNGKGGKVAVPPSIDGQAVVEIGEEAFAYCEELTHIVIPKGVTSIGDNAFSNCENLTSITIPDGVTSIGALAFSDCESLTSISIPDGVTSIGNMAFFGCESLTSITIPNSVTSIGHGAFWYCRSLTSITIPDSVTSIGDCAFDHCSNLKRFVVDAGNQMYYVRDNVLFSHDNELVRYPAGLSASSYVIPTGMMSIGYGAFAGCSKLSQVTFPSQMPHIGKNAFGKCPLPLPTRMKIMLAPKLKT